MTALTVVRAADRNVTALRLTRAAWHHHRAAFLTIAGVFGAGLIAFVVEGLWMRYNIDQGHLAGCVRFVISENYFPSWCDSRTFDSLLNGKWNPSPLQDLLGVAPLLIALFAGLPWLTREFESGSFRYTWAQEAGRMRWLLGTFLPLTAAAAAGAGIVSAVCAWWYRDAQVTIDLGGSAGWAVQSFGDSPELLVAFTVLGMSLALLAGLLIRRTVPAMAACTAACAACYAVTQEWFRNWLITRAPVVTKSPFYLFSNLRAPQMNDLWLRSYTTAPDGQVVVNIRSGGSSTNRAFETQISHISYKQLPGWLTQHHYLSWMAYQPHSRLTGFEFAEAEVVLAAAVIAFAAALILFRRRALFAGLAVNRLAENVGVAVMAGILLDHVAQDPAQARCLAVRPGTLGQLAEVAIRQCLREQSAGAFHALLPQREQLLGGVLGGRAPLPVRIGFPVHRVPRLSLLAPVQVLGEPAGFDQGHVLEQPAEGHRRGRGRGP
jgi:hypothetical protein